MKKFIFTYIDGDTINLTATIMAKSANQAYVKFYEEYGCVVDIVKVEQVEE